MRPDPVIIEFLESVVYGDRTDLPAVIIRAVLRALSAVYRAGLRIYLLPFDIGLRRRQHLRRPVISVGNLTVGGTGKTPTTRCLCNGLISRGLSPAVLSYGYRGSLCGRLGIVSDREKVLLTPNAAGDEPVMMARAMPGVPVLVCKSRGRSGRVAVQDLGADVLVLDDGFQVWKLHRDLDIVLVNISAPFDNGRTLPAGKLRESLSALRRADCVIATGECDPDTGNDSLARIRQIAPDVPVYLGRFKASRMKALADGGAMELESIRGKRTLALSSIANPVSFEETLRATGAVIVDKERFPDHHPYSDEDIEYLSRRAADLGVEYIVTTDKDAVKLDGRAFGVPALSLGIEMSLDDEAGFWRLVGEKIGEITSAR